MASSSLGVTDNSHECPAPECERRCPPHILACARHWKMLPREIAIEVWRAWRNRDKDYWAVLDTRQKAVDWWAAHVDG